jgi:uncharacterized protein YndB with AHSA1/START domain/Zn-dependent protease
VILVQFVLAFTQGMADLARAIWHMITRQRRNTYHATVSIAAPREKVWELLTRPDITYQSIGMRTISRAVGDSGDIFHAEVILHGKSLGIVAFEYTERRPFDLLESRYIAEQTSAKMSIGADDFFRFRLSDGKNGRTVLRLSRELTHLTPSSRIAVPLAVRTTGYLVKQQAELEAGNRRPSSPMRQQLVLAPLALVSFAWMLGWLDGLILMILIAIHEAGHALAMLYYGLGVRLISFIPFLGGAAAPKRYYDTEWQRAIVLLMGVGFSLPFTAALLWWAYQTFDPNVAKAASLFAIVNGVNLLPIPMLDGGGVSAMLLRRLHRWVAHAVAVAMLAGVAGLAIWINDPVLWVTFVMSIVCFVQITALKLDDRLAPTTRGRAVAIAVLYLGLIACYLALSIVAVRFEGDLP